MYATFSFVGGIVRGLVTDIRSSHAEVKLINKKLKPREKQFCGYFVCTGSAEESARRAGYRKNCRLAGERLLCDERVLDEIERLIALRRRVLPKLASAGYYRMAFGGVSDALRLLYSERPTGKQAVSDDDLSEVAGGRNILTGPNSGVLYPYSWFVTILRLLVKDDENGAQNDPNAPENYPTPTPDPNR